MILLDLPSEPSNLISDFFRDVMKIYKFNQQLEYFQSKMEPTFKKLGIETEELYEYLESDETYQDRVRQQRLSRSLIHR